MKATIIASSLILLSALACAGPGQPTAAAQDAAQEREELRWEVQPAGGKAGQPRLRLNGQRTNHDMTLGAEFARKRPEFAAAQGALGGDAGPVRFTVVHEAGTLLCSGTLTRAFAGRGQCDFAPDAGFERALGERGLVPDRRSDLLAMLVVDATLALADGLANEGVKPRDWDDLIAAAALDVTPAYVRDLKHAPLALSEIEDAIACKALGVDGAYVQGLTRAGYTKLTADQAVSMKALGVSPDYARAMNRATGAKAQ